MYRRLPRTFFFRHVRHLPFPSSAYFASVSIGGVSIATNDAQDPFRIPQLSHVYDTQAILCSLRWMMQKDSMGQDIFLTGPPGPLRRWLALRYCQLAQREVEYLAISRDTTEADIKVRREIIDGSVHWINQCAVNAAIHGRVLILDGIEKAERNVLPVINNLLENREMALDDGRYLMNAQRYDELMVIHGAEGMEQLGYVRVSPDFRVIALGQPVPPNVGLPLDPPLRSRFQCLAVDMHSTTELLEHLTSLAPNVPSRRLRSLVTIMEVLKEARCPKEDQDDPELLFLDFGDAEVLRCAQLLQQLPQLSLKSALSTVYPFRLLHVNGVQRAQVFNDVLQKTGDVDASLAVTTIMPVGDHVARITFQCSFDDSAVDLEVACGAAVGRQPTAPIGNNETHHQFVEVAPHMEVLHSMILTHALGQHICLVSENGNGKTCLAHQFCHMLGYDREVHTIQLYADMTTRDLLQRRMTDEKGDTAWQLTPLMLAAQRGGVAILDGIDKLKPGCLPFLQRLLVDGDIALYDGTLFKSHAEFEKLLLKTCLTESALNAKGVFKVHPSFRVIALASSSQELKWLQGEAHSMFSYHYLRPLNDDELKCLVSMRWPQVSTIDMEQVLAFRAQLSAMAASDPSLTPLSLRQVLQVFRHLASYASEVHAQLCSVMLYKFQPIFQQQKIDEIFRLCSISKPSTVARDMAVEARHELQNGKVLYRLVIGDTEVCIAQEDANECTVQTLVPSTLFFDNALHTEMLQAMLKSFNVGDHLLLIGNQGVGKNKLADHFLNLLHLPRQYIQLHRDTTVHSLTVSASVHGGVVRWEDSPLVKAAKHGHVLMIDEADKAPVEVVGVLKGLVEDRHMVLADGRRIVSSADVAADDPNAIVIHPRFRVFALSNRPGYPFLGNDFFVTCGDLFACHAVDNPDEGSIETVLRSYGPDVDRRTMNLLIETFTEVAKMVEKGILSYPYSLREMVSVVKHLQRYPSDGLEVALNNVFHFDKHDIPTYRLLSEVFHQRGVRIGSSKAIPQVKGKLTVEVVESPEPPPTGDPKHGEEELPDDMPHFGGNQFAGGSGGTDTAGMGGRFGPYRLDIGLPVHQVSDDEKERIDIQAKARARAMGREALARRLQEIDMSTKDDILYSRIYNQVSHQISVLKEMIKGLQFKSTERTWVRHQTDGIWDDNKLIEGLTGERNIFKRRAEDPDSMNWAGEVKKKRLVFVVDVSASMYRFNSLDLRLDRTMEVVVMVMEALHGFEDKLWYTIAGHSGDEVSVPLVRSTAPPQSKLERLKVVQKLQAHSQFCWAGDNTLGAIHQATKDVVKEEGSDYYVIVISDANFQRYRIQPQQVTAAMKANKEVKTFCIFISSMWNEAPAFAKQLPVGQAFMCLDTKELPNILKQVLMATKVL